MSSAHEPTERLHLNEKAMWALVPEHIGKARRYGKNAAIGVSFLPVWTGGVVYPWPTAALPMRVKAGGNAADDAAAGANGRTVWVTYLNAAWEEVTEELDLAGALASAPLSQDAIRFQRAWVGEVGAYGVANLGDIDFEQVGVGATIGQIVAGQGQTQQCIHTIPAGKVGHLWGFDVATEATKVFTMRLCKRTNVLGMAEYRSMRVSSEFPGLVTSHERKFSVPVNVEPMTDVWIDAKVAGLPAALFTAEMDLVIGESTEV